MITKKSMKKDDKAVSPVVAVIMLIAITVIIAAVVAAFAYGIIGGVNKAPNIAFVIDNAEEGSKEFYVIHHGGEEISDAYTFGTTPNSEGQKDIATWVNLAVKVNGLSLTNSTAYEGGDGETTFSAGEMLNCTYAAGLQKGDTISVVYEPTDALMQRIKVN